MAANPSYEVPGEILRATPAPPKPTRRKPPPSPRTARPVRPPPKPPTRRAPPQSLAVPVDVLRAAAPIGPVPRVLSDSGVTSMQTAAQRLTDAHMAYVSRFGHPMTPGLALDLMRTEPGAGGYESLFGVPGSHAQVSQRASLATPLAEATSFVGNVITPRWTPEQIGKYKVIPGINTPVPWKGLDAAGIAADAHGFLDLFANQIADSLIQLPYGAYQIGKAGVLDVKDIAAGKTPTHLYSLGKQMAISTLNDFQHPLQNPGYLAMDIAAVATAGVGTIVRVGAAGAALRAGEFSTAARALAFRPVAHTYQLGYGSMVAQIPEFENAALRLLMRPINIVRAKNLEERMTGQAISQSNIPVVGDFIDRHLTAESKMRRRRTADDAFQYKLSTIDSDKLLRMRRWTAVAGDSLEAIYRDRNMRVLRDGLPAKTRLAMEKIVFANGMADATPFETLIRAHEERIAQIENALVQARTGVEMPGVKDSFAGHTLSEHPTPNEVADLERMLAAHKFHLEATRLGRELDLNPTKRVRPFVEQARRVSDSQERLKKIIFGADEEMLFNHLLEVGSYIRGEDVVPGAGAHVVNGELVPIDPTGIADAFYSPMQRDLYWAPTRRGFFGSRGSGRFGLGPPNIPQSMTYHYGGGAFEYGDFRWDTSALIAEESQKVAKLGIQFEEWNKLWQAGHSTPGGVDPRFLRGIRDVRQAPDRLRAAASIIDKRELHEKDTIKLDAKSHQDLVDWLYPKLTDFGPEDTGKVRYVDERWFMDTQKREMWQALDKGFGAAFSVPNEIMRFLYLFSRPAYLINFLGAGALAMIQQGVFAVPNVIRALRKTELYGEAMAEVIRRLAGTTKTQAVLTETNRITRGSQAMAAFWNVFTDQLWRESSAIHELRKRGMLPDGVVKGHPNDERWGQVVDGLTKDDPKTKAALNEVRARVGKHMVEFENLTWPEKAVARHALFIYAWVSRSALWSLHFMAEHPIQWAVGAQAARDYNQEVERLIGAVPEWFNRTGYIPIGRNFVFNPIQFGTPASITQVAYPILSLFKHDKYSSLFDLLSPTWQAAIQAAQASTSTAQHGTAVDAIIAAATATPIGSAFGRAATGGSTTPGPAVPGTAATPLSLLNGALADERSGLKEHTMVADDFWSTWGLYIGGSGVPRQTNRKALEARAWRDMRQTDPAAFIEHQHTAAVQMIRNQAKILGTQPSRAVLDGVRLISDIELAKEKRMEQTGQTSVGQRDDALITVAVMRKSGYLTPAEGQAALKAIKDDTTGTRLTTIRADLLRQHGAKELWLWMTKADAVNKLTSTGVDAAITNARGAGIGTYPGALNASPATKQLYARQLIAYQDKVDMLTKQIAAGAPASTLKAFEAQQDHDIVVNGIHFPSPVRQAWAAKSPEERKAALISAGNAIDTTSWAGIPAYEKQALLGRSVPVTVDAGWAALSLAEEQYRQTSGKTYVTASQALAVAKQLDRDPRYKGIYQDVLLSQQAPLVRFQYLTVYQKSDNRSRWDVIINQATQVERVLEQARSKTIGLTMTQVRETWKTYVDTTIAQWLTTQPKAFQDEVSGFGKTFLENFIG